MSTDLHTLSGAYVLHALSDEEPCRDEVRELAEAAARMGAGEATSPPAGLRARVLAAADRQPQLPPLAPSMQTAPARRRLTRLGIAAAAAVLVAVAAIGIARLQGTHEPPLAGPTVSQVFRAPDARVATLRTSDGDRLRVALSKQTGRMAVATGTLHPLSDGKVYQLWALRNGRATSAGVVTDRKVGKVMPIPASGTKVAITVERAGGSNQPTSDPIVEVDPAKV
jgi:anti-sigma-K factor RskA